MWLIKNMQVVLLCGWMQCVHTVTICFLVCLSYVPDTQSAASLPLLAQQNGIFIVLFFSVATDVKTLFFTIHEVLGLIFTKGSIIFEDNDPILHMLVPKVCEFLDLANNLKVKLEPSVINQWVGSLLYLMNRIFCFYEVWYSQHVCASLSWQKQGDLLFTRLENVTKQTSEECVLFGLNENYVLRKEHTALRW